MSRTNFHELPILDVHKDNIETAWPILLDTINAATFIGLDAELSGLGAKSGLNSADIEERYRSMVASSQTRSLLSVGLSCFARETPSSSSSSSNGNQKISNRLEVNGEDEVACESERCRNESNPIDDATGRGDGSDSAVSPSLRFRCQTFNIFTLCQDDFMVEPDSLMFLVGHGFDFNLQFEKGLPYHHGVDVEKENGEKTVRNLFGAIVAAKKPLILHNGILDLVFLYGNLYAPLPVLLSTFVADLAEMFPSGIYDTKCFAEYKIRLDASYLTYVFRKLQRQNHDKEIKGKPHVVLNFSGGFVGNEKLAKEVLYRDCSIREPPAFQVSCERTVCENFASHGWCTSAHSCPMSHDIDDILDLETNRQGFRRSRKNKRRLKSIALDSQSVDVEEQNEGCEGDGVALSKDDSHIATRTNGSSTRAGKRTESISSVGIIHNTHGHRAGYDAFMTGFSLACLMAQQLQHQQPSLQQKDCFSGLYDFRNKLFLSRKDFQLAITKSAFGKVSREHMKKMDKLKSYSCQ